MYWTGYFCCSLFLVYLKFGVFADTLLGVLAFLWIAFPVLFISGWITSVSELLTNYFCYFSLLVELLVPCQHLGTVLLINRFAGYSWNNTWLLQNRLLKLQESKWWPTFMPNLLTQVSHHHLQSSTIPACSWQGTCSRTGQPAANCSTNNSAGCWAPLHALMADSRGSPSGSETSLLSCRNPRAATTGSPVTTKWCDPNAVLVRSLFKSTIQIRSALPAFIRLTKPIRDACLTVSNTCSNAQSWNLEYEEVFQRVFQNSFLPSHRNSPKDKYFNQKHVKRATIISPNGNLNWAAQWAAMWMLVTKNPARGSYTDVWS